MALQTEPPLPPRYHKIACMLMQGKRRKQISLETKLTLNTVHTYAKNLFQIADVESINAFYNWALQHGYTLQGNWQPYEP